jgi:lysine biosynthesis protein LysW
MLAVLWYTIAQVAKLIGKEDKHGEETEGQAQAEESSVQEGLQEEECWIEVGLMEHAFEAQYPGWETTRQQSRQLSKGDRKVAECPECERNVVLSDRVVVGHRVECPGCGEKLEVISLRPPELDYAFDDDDWDWDEEEDE